MHLRRNPPADAGQPEVLVDALKADRRAMLRSDALVSALLIIASWAMLWWAFRDKGRRVIAGAGISVLVLASMFIIGKRYLSSDDFVTPRDFNAQFNKRPVDEMILSDTDPSYRVLDLTVNVFNDSHPSYWHKNIGGYSPAKLQVYQEYIESQLYGDLSALTRSISGVKTIGEAEEAVPYLEGLADLNCRYIILDGNAAPVRYKYAKGNAWFEDDSLASIKMTSYAPNELHYHYSAPQPATAVFSEVYYPDGWSLKVEDTGEILPVSLSRRVLRSAQLPAGEHDLVMRFEPKSYVHGRNISMICSIITILLALAGIGIMVWKSVPKKR